MTTNLSSSSAQPVKFYRFAENGGSGDRISKTYIDEVGIK